MPYYPKGGTGIVDVRDVSSFIVNLMESTIEGERFVLSGGNISYKDLFTKLAKSMNRKAPKKVAPDWMLSFLWRIDSIRSFITKQSPIVTKESVKSTSHQSKYDNSKSLNFNDFKYRDFDKTLLEYGQKYAEFRNK